VDGLAIDSIGLEGTYAQPFYHNLEDLFFRYGIRLNTNLVKDGASALMVPLVVGQMGNQPNIQPVPYRFFPLINNFGPGVITRNLDMIVTKFASTLDTVKAPGIRKTPLLKTTPYTHVLQAPALVTYNDARKDTDVEVYREGEKTIAYLLEGSFTSLYKNRILPSDSRSEFFKPQSEETRLLICSDGDLVVNEINRRTGEPLPLGFDKISSHTFGNADFILNTTDYLIDEHGVISARNKEVKLRPLDSIKIRDNRNRIQLINLLIPSLLVLIPGLIRGWWWKRKFSV
jgi:gliding-associated putative ABC transporter substrate-binding component GldG